jgi:hypothetical protein
MGEEGANQTNFLTGEASQMMLVMWETMSSSNIRFQVGIPRYAPSI